MKLEFVSSRRLITGRHTQYRFRTIIEGHQRVVYINIADDGTVGQCSFEFATIEYSKLFKAAFWQRRRLGHGNTNPNTPER